MTNIFQRTFTNKKVQPLLAAAALGALLVGCTPATNDTGATPSSRSAASRAPRTASSAAATQDSSTSAVSQSSAATTDESVYKDGTYSAEGTYRSPAGAEQIDISVTLKDGIITASTFTPHATAPKSVTMQKNFAAGYEALVVGKSIDDVAITVVNGSSLTGTGFMEALNKIKAEAKA